MRQVTGNILEIDEGVIVQQVNCRGVMGAGFAKALRDAYPVLFDEYSRLCGKIAPRGLFGCVQFVQVTERLIVANSFSQLNFGNAYKTHEVYTDPRVLVGNIAYVVDKFPDKRVYIPFGIGCGLAGGYWDVISAGLDNIDVTVMKLPDEAKDPKRK